MAKLAPDSSKTMGLLVEVWLNCSHEAFLKGFTQKYEAISQSFVVYSKKICVFWQKINLFNEEIKVKFSPSFLTIILTLKNENKIFLTGTAPG